MAFTLQDVKIIIVLKQPIGYTKERGREGPTIVVGFINKQNNVCNFVHISRPKCERSFCLVAIHFCAEFDQKYANPKDFLFLWIVQLFFVYHMESRRMGYMANERGMATCWVPKQHVPLAILITFVISIEEEHTCLKLGHLFQF